MKVTVSCAGRFHAFELLQGLEERGALERFITTTLNSRLLPNRALPEKLKSNSTFLQKVRQIPLPEYLSYIVRQVPLPHRQALSYLIKDTLYDQQAVRFVPNCQLFVGWANQSLFQLREAKSRGARTIIERGSVHISTQYQILHEEEARFLGSSPHENRFDRLMEEKQLKEYRETDYVMVPSQFARRTFLERGFESARILTVPYGVDLDAFYPLPDRRSNGPFTILFVGELSFQKGVPYLLEAVQLLKARGVEIRLKIIGRAEPNFAVWLKKSPLRGIIDEQLSSIPRSAIVEHFHSADALVLPSLQEGLALVTLEAMASGLPVIATPNTGAEEYIANERSGFIVPIRNSSAIVRRIEQLLDPSVWKSIRESGLANLPDMSKEVYGERAYDTYKRILQSEPPVAKHNSEQFYTDYWDRSKAWTPTHSFTDEQLKLHFGGAFTQFDKVLDVGCGDATNYEAWLKDQVSELHAIDISPEGVENANRMGLKARVHDLSARFPYKDATFDGAVSIEVLEHLYDPKYCIKETFRVLKPGGLFVASVPNSGYLRERLKMLLRAELSTSIPDLSNEWNGAHIRFFNLDSLRRMFETAGFSIETVQSNNESSLWDALEPFGGYFTQHLTAWLRNHAPRVLRFAYLEHILPSLFAPHLIVRARKPYDYV